MALLAPSAANNRIRARCAEPAEIVDDRVHPDNRPRSPALKTNGSTRDIPDHSKPRPQSHTQHATLERSQLSGLRFAVALRCEPPSVVSGYCRDPVHAVPLTEQPDGLLRGPLALRNDRAAHLDFTEQLTLRPSRHSHPR